MAKTPEQKQRELERRIEEELDDEWEDDGSKSPGAQLLRKFGDIRKRILIVLGTMFFWICVVLAFANRIFEFLLYPLCAAIPQGTLPPPGIPVGSAARTFGACQLYPTDLMEPMIVIFKMSILLALFGSAPVIFYQVWRMVSPYISKTAKTWTLGFVSSASLFFVGGAAFGFFFVFPRAFAFLRSVGGDAVVPLPTMASYFSIVSMLLLGFGVSFELPLLMFLLSRLGVTSAKFYAKYRRHAIFVLMIFSAIITPTPDPLTMLGLALPLVGLYELGILLSRFAGKSDGPTLLERRLKELDGFIDEDDEEDEESDLPPKAAGG